jgi:hypothetical protein
MMRAMPFMAKPPLLRFHEERSAKLGAVNYCHEDRKARKDLEP